MTRSPTLPRSCNSKTDYNVDGDIFSRTANAQLMTDVNFHTFGLLFDMRIFRKLGKYYYYQDIGTTEIILFLLAYYYLTLTRSIKSLEYQ